MRIDVLERAGVCQASQKGENNPNQTVTLIIISSSVLRSRYFSKASGGRMASFISSVIRDSRPTGKKGFRLPIPPAK